MKRRDRIVNKAAGVKIIRLVKRRADLTLAQFRDYWLTRHALHEQHAMATTPLQRVRGEHRHRRGRPGRTVPRSTDGGALFQELETPARRCRAETAAMREDAKNFVDPRLRRRSFAERSRVRKEDASERRRSGQLKTIRTH